MTYDYKEENLINEFSPWFKNARGYREVFEDTDTSGSDPVDSAGFIGDQTVLIEFKDTLAPSEVRYEGSKGSSIEKKLGRFYTIYIKITKTESFDHLQDGTVAKNHSSSL